MELVQATNAFCFTWAAYDQAEELFVSFDIYDVTSGTAELVHTTAGVYGGFGIYAASYTGMQGHTYLIIGAAYVADDFIVPNPNYAPGADSYQVLAGPVTLLCFNYATYDQNQGLSVQAQVYDVSSGTPTLVEQVDMDLVGLGVYAGTFEGELGKTYAVATVVFTDDTYLTPDLARAPGTETFDCILTSGGNVFNTLSEATLVGQSTSATLEGNCA